MSQRMLIDARHPEETRVAVVNGTRIEEFDFEAAERKQLKGNIYLAKVTRVEPSLQAAFIDYGGNRHGFLAFSEIHPDYYQIPREDREALLREEAELAAEEHHDEPEIGEDGEEIAVTGGADDAGSDVLRRQRQALRRKYKIQEVIRRRQVILVQVVKEERGNKGAALTTYLSLAGRFCVLMPNTAHGGGISRKISNLSDRKRLKSIMADLQLPAGMGAIVRTAGLKRTRTEIKRDFDYLTRLWDEIRDTTLASVAPCLVHQDSDLIKRAIRDIYSRDIEQVLVDGPEGFAAASTFMQLLMPTHAAKVVQYTDAVPLFQRFGVEASLAGMYQPVVQLKSGGYIVINPTEALVSIDVNSGRSTREHGIEETAYKTNLEAADEIGRQLRLRDMAGLVVIDFIDMEIGGNNRRVERAMKEAMKNDRARIALGRISSFGLMEMSRQRLRTGVLEASTHVCPMCDGSGYVRSVGSAALAALRALEAEAIKGKNDSFQLRAGLEVAMYILNRKRADVVELEERYGVDIETIPDETLMGPNFVLDAAGPPPANPVVMSPLPPVIAVADDDELPSAEDAVADDEDDERSDGTERSGRGRRGRGRRDEAPAAVTLSDDGDTATTDEDDTEGEVRADSSPRETRDGGEGRGRGRRRRRRGGRDRRPEGDAPAAVADAPLADIAANADLLVHGDDAAEVAAGYDPEPVGDGVAALTPAGSTADAADGDIRRRRRGRRGGRRREGGPAGTDDHAVETATGDEATTAPAAAAAAAAAPAPAETVAAETPNAETAADDATPAKKPRRSRAKASAAPADDAPTAAPTPAPAEPAPAAAADDAAKPRRPRRKLAAEPVAAGPAIVAEPDAFVDTAAVVAPVTEPANDVAAPVADDAEPAPRKGGWWQRTFGS
jgi:ribonuclease E